MARSSSESTSDLYIRLGLSSEELESGFVNAERTIRDNMTRLSRDNTIIDLQAQVEILGLDETADATRILEIRQRALQRQIEVQRDRVRLASAELRNMTERTGENSDQTQRASLAHERERVALARLERQMRELNETQSETAESNEAGIGGLDNLVDNVLDRIPPQAKAAAGAIAGIGAAMIAAGKASADLIRKWGELQKQAYELNMSVNDTENFLRKMTLAGGDIEDFKGFIRGISDAMVKGEFGDPEEVVFRRYGESAFDAKGRLKNFQEMTETIERMYDKAKAAGEEIEFLQMLGGESGVTDAIQYLERRKEAQEDAEKIFDAGLDPEDMHESSRALNLLTMQVDEFTDALTDIITPATTEAFEDLFEVFHEGTRILSENKEEIRDWGDIALDAAKNALLHSQLGMAFLPFALFGDDEKELDKQQKKLSKTTKSWADFHKEQEQAKKSVEEKLNPLSQYGDQRARDLEDEIADLRIAIDYENEYQRAVATAQLERERALRNINMSARERAAVEKKYLAEIEQAEKDHNDKIEEMEKETAAIQFETSHSAFEKEIYDIEQWKNKALEDLGEYNKAIGDKSRWVKEAAAITENALAKEAKAYEDEIDRIRGKIESAQDRLARLTLSQRDNDIYQAQKQYYQDLQELPKEFADAIYKAQIASINKRTREDKSGSYRKRPDGAPNDDTYYQLLDFTNANKHINNAAENLVKLDAEEMARAELLKKSALGIAEVERSANKSGRATTELANANLALANTNLKTGTASEQAAQQLKDTADTASNFGGTLQNANSAIDKNISALKNATSATGTFIRGLANVADIEAQKDQEKFSLPDLKPTQEPQGERIKIMYGNREDEDFEDNDDVPVLYGKFADLGNATEKLSANIQSVKTDYLEQLNTSAEKTSASLAQVDSSNVQQAATKAADSAEMLSGKFPSLATALDSVTNSLQQAADKIAKIDFKAPSVQQTLQQPALQGNNSDRVNKSLDATQTSGKIMNWMGTLMTAAPLFMLGGPPGAAEAIAMQGVRLALLGSGVEIGADVAQQAYNINKDTANLSAPIPQDIPTFEAFNLGLDKSVTSLDTFSKALSDSVSKFENIDVSKKDSIDITPITKDLATLTQNVGAIAADLKDMQGKNSTPPVINVNPNISIDLGGAYVFDDAMKAQLTDDIGTNVANSITDAVQRANNQGLFGFNN